MEGLGRMVRSKGLKFLSFLPKPLYSLEEVNVVAATPNALRTTAPKPEGERLK